MSIKAAKFRQFDFFVDKIYTIFVEIYIEIRYNVILYFLDRGSFMFLSVKKEILNEHVVLMKISAKRFVKNEVKRWQQLFVILKIKQDYLDN